MKATTRVRFYLILIAVLPPLLLLSVIYFYSVKQYERLGSEKTYLSLERFSKLRQAYLNDLRDKALELSESSELRSLDLLISSGRSDQIDLSRLSSDFDLIELIDSSGKVLASDHRPGMVGEGTKFPDRTKNSGGAWYFEKTEYDLMGRFAGFGYLVYLENSSYLYLSKYFDSAFLLHLEQLLDGRIDLYFSDETNSDFNEYVNLPREQLFQDNNGESLVARLAGDRESGFVLMARFDIHTQKPIFLSLLRITALAALVSILLAVLVGIYITGQTKKEIDNLIEATQKISDGDLSTPVMAYQEGEFSQLADSFTGMKAQLRQTLKDLSTSEKIAAWKEMGQKIAHEVKNPLTPIAISIDDLRRSYQEKLPNFDQIIDQTTKVIKIEISRLIKLLDQFVKFARMEPPIIIETDISTILDDVIRLYHQENESGKLILKNNSVRFKVKIDGEKIKQLLINIIKNGLESSEEAQVVVTLSDSENYLIICLEDTGPGFSPEILNSHFKPYASTKKNGSGLGLVISARIVHDHGGTIEIVNKEEGGGLVKISLPV